MGTYQKNTVAKITSQIVTLEQNHLLKLCAEYDLNTSDMRAIAVLYRMGQIATGEIAQFAGIKAAAVTTLVDRLENKKILERVRIDGDRRKVYIHLSKTFLVSLSEHVATLRNCASETLSSLGPTELAAVVMYLESYLNSLQRLETMESGAKVLD